MNLDIYCFLWLSLVICLICNIISLFFHDILYFFLAVNSFLLSNFLQLLNHHCCRFSLEFLFLALTVFNYWTAYLFFQHSFLETAVFSAVFLSVLLIFSHHLPCWCISLKHFSAPLSYCSCNLISIARHFVLYFLVDILLIILILLRSIISSM